MHYNLPLELVNFIEYELYSMRLIKKDSYEMKEKYQLLKLLKNFSYRNSVFKRKNI